MCFFLNACDFPHLLISQKYLNVYFKLFVYVISTIKLFFNSETSTFWGVAPHDILQPELMLTCHKMLFSVLRDLLTLTYSHEGL